MDRERLNLFGRGELVGICFIADQVTHAAREVASVPLSANLVLPDTSGSPCVSVPVLTGVGVDTGSRNTSPGLGVLKGVLTIVSN